MKKAKLFKYCKQIIKFCLQFFFGLPIPWFMISKKSNVILAMRGHDFEALPIFSFIKKGIKIESILALDDKAIAIALKNKIPFIIYEDFLKEKQLNEAAEKAYHSSWNWANNISEINNMGVDWSKFDHEALFYCIHELYIARCAAQQLKKKGKKLLVIQYSPFNAPVYYYGIDNFAYGASSVSDSVISRIIIHDKTLSGSEENKADDHQSWDDISDITDKIICVLNVAEIDRCREMLNALCDAFPDRICIFALGRYTGEFSRAPVFSTPSSCPAEGDTSFLPVLDHPNSHYAYDQELLPHLKKILHSYCNYRWPSLKRAICRFKEIFTLYSPACVLGTTLYDAESQLATVAARQAGIPTLSWGHAVAQGMLPVYPAENIIVLCRYAMRSLYLQGNARSHNLIASSSAGLDTLYRSSQEKWKDNRFKVLVLPASPFYEGTSFLGFSFSKLALYIKCLCRIPEDLASKITLRFKSHPLHSFESIFAYINHDFDQWCFSKDKDLLTLLDQADCCILLGEWGCAFVHSCSRLPTIFCPIPQYFRCPQHDLLEREFPHCCNHPEDIWETVRRVISDKNYAQHMLDAQKAWIKYDSTYPTPEQVLQNILDNKSVRHETCD